MSRIDVSGGNPAPEPRRKIVSAEPVAPALAGTARPQGVPQPITTSGRWRARYDAWERHFNSGVRSNLVRYWQLWRNRDPQANPGPGEEWRDRTVIPEAFKVIEARLARLVMGLFGRRDWMAVKGVERSDAEFESVARALLETKLAEIGMDDEDGSGLIVRAVEGLRYEQIVGHVWWRLWWRRKTDRMLAPALTLDENGEAHWRQVEFLMEVYDGLDFAWLPVDSIAFNLTGPRLWTIERIRTTLEALEEEDELWRRETGRPLYTNLRLAARSTLERASLEEPRDTERWPLDDKTGEEPSWAIGERPVELWLCWDHRARTLTKLVNGVVVAHGRAPTPDGRAPYWATKAVPVPNRPYGESILNWTGPLHRYQTRIARARMDEILLNIWQQHIIRSGALRSDRMLFRPGGAVVVDVEPGENVNAAFAILPRRPVFQEAWSEELHRQRMAESTAATDAVQMGAEATTKSRDVTATEIRQRILQGGARHQLDILFHQVAFMRPLLRRAFALVRQNLGPEDVERIVGKAFPLERLRTPVDMKLGGGLYEATREERLANVRAWLELAASPAFSQYIDARQVLRDFASWQGETDPERYVHEEPMPATPGPMPASQPKQPSMPAPRELAF